MNYDLRREHLVSVIIPTYNRAERITRAIDSVLSQCIYGDEVIIIDDGSTDTTQDVLSCYGGRVTYLRVEHGGVGRARNLGLDAAQNGLIAFLDSDDQWANGKLPLQRNFLIARSDVLFCFSQIAYRYSSQEEQNGSILYGIDFSTIKNYFTRPVIPFSSAATLPKGWDDFLVYIGDLYPIQMAREYVQVNTLVFRRDRFRGISVRFPEDLTTREDWEFVGQLSRNGPAAYMDCVTSYVYRHEGPQISKLHPIHYYNARIKTLERVWGADKEYLEGHRQEYGVVLNRQYNKRIRELLRLGRPAEALADIAKAKNISFKYRLLAHLPIVLVRIVWKLRMLFFPDK
jgi:glycosyltransferase involved in cell wall biosynthesis